jgi:hypothetical protein
LFFLSPIPNAREKIHSSLNPKMVGLHFYCRGHCSLEIPLPEEMPYREGSLSAHRADPLTILIIRDRSPLLLIATLFTQIVEKLASCIVTLEDGERDAPILIGFGQEFRAEAPATRFPVSDDIESGIPKWIA